MIGGAKTILVGVVVVVVGALLGTFIGDFIGHSFPEGMVHDLFSKEISAGLQPTTLDLRVIELTVGCLLKLNVSSIVGILLAAYLFKKFLK